MKVRTRKINGFSLTGPEKRNLIVLEKAVKKLESLEEFNNTIGAEVQETKSGSYLLLSSFSSEHLSIFIIQLLIQLRNEELNISYADKNVEHLWAPVWTNKIKLNVD